MDWQQVASRRRSRPGADLLHLARPVDSEGLLSPYAFEHGAIGSLRGAIDEARDIREAHFHRGGRRPLRLLGARVAQPATGRTQVPEIAATEVPLPPLALHHPLRLPLAVLL